MAEALAIIGLAANIAQFLEYGINFISAAKNAYRSGQAINELPELELYAKTIKSHCTKITSLPTPALSQDERDIYSIAESCSELANGLLEVLKSLKLKIDSGSLTRMMEIIRISGSNMRNQNRIIQLENRLNRLYAILQGSLSNLLQRNHHTRITSMISDLSRQNESMNVTFPKRLLEIQSTITKSIQENTKDLSELLLSLQIQAEKTDMTQQILKGLLFSSIKGRESMIESAHKETLTWVFDKNATSFPDWLESDDESIYWIQGLAGSGKSTLMKFICHHEQTMNHLRKWAGSQQLLTSSFFFWSPGDSMQKSQLGLFQSLLYQILRADVNLAAYVCPDRIGSEPWTECELLAAFERLSNVTELDWRFCFFIDGLDEYQGRDSNVQQPEVQIVALMEILNSSRHIKVCVSSRPWPIFKEAFGGNHTVMVQDHTAKDMEKFVTDLLSENDEFRIKAIADTRYASFMTQIVFNACGVWLWAFLVTKEILKDLTGRENLEVLQCRLDGFPKNLDGYFEKMMSRIDPLHQKETLQIFTLVAEHRYRMPVVYLHFLPRLEEAEFPFNDNIQPIDDEDLQTIQTDWEGRLQHRCGDFLKIVGPSYPPRSKDGVVHKGLTFIHRTADEFIKKQYHTQPKPWPSGRLDAKMALTALGLALLKARCRPVTQEAMAIMRTKLPQQSIPLAEAMARFRDSILLQAFILYLYNLEGTPIWYPALSELGYCLETETCRQFLGIYCDIVGVPQGDLDGSCISENTDLLAPCTGTSREFAVAFILRKAKATSIEEKSILSLLLLACLKKAFLTPAIWFSPNAQKAITASLQLGADPNYAIAGGLEERWTQSIWAWFLASILDATLLMNRDIAIDITAMIKKLIEHGADLDVEVRTLILFPVSPGPVDPRTERPGPQTISGREVLDQALHGEQKASLKAWIKDFESRSCASQKNRLEEIG